MQSNVVRAAAWGTAMTMLIPGCRVVQAPQPDALRPAQYASATPRVPKRVVLEEALVSPSTREYDGALDDSTTVEGATAAINRCHKGNEGFACADAVEPAAIAAKGGRVWRTGARICIRPSQAEDVCVTTNTTDEGAEFIAYTYLGQLSGPRLHVLRIRYYEGQAALLVDAVTGHQKLVSAIPKPSPDGRYLAVASKDMDAAFDPNEFVIYRYERGAILQELKISPDDWGAGTPRWLSATRVDLPVETAVGGTGGYRVTGKRTYDWTGRAGGA